MRTLLLFDIDGTLITTGGAGYRAMKHAVETVCGVPRAMEGISVAGRTDSIILRDAVAALDGSAITLELRDRIRDVYLGYLRQELRDSGGGPGVLPGVRDLLDRLATQPQYELALLTGNFSQSAQIKLGFHDLWRYFAWGAFGEDAVERNDLLPVALGRYEQRAGQRIEPRDVVIIGDTPHDVGVARTGGTRAVCVATGQFGRDVLIEAGADDVFHDLSDVEEVLRVLAGVQAG